MTDFNEILRQAKAMQEQMKKAQEELLAQEVEGISGAGLVKVVMNGRHDIRNVWLDPALLSEDKEVIEDLIAAAVNDAVRRIEEQSRGALSGLASGLNLPEGFKLPF